MEQKKSSLDDIGKNFDNPNSNPYFNNFAMPRNFQNYNNFQNDFAQQNFEDDSDSGNDSDEADSQDDQNGNIPQKMDF